MYCLCSVNVKIIKTRVDSVFFSQIDWRKAKKEKIHRIYDEYQKPNFPREIQATKLDESSATKLS